MADDFPPPAAATERPELKPIAGERFLLLLVAAALIAGLARRALVGWDAPLWLDEAFTAAIAIQPSLAGLLRDCLNELGGPVYYALIWTWEKLFGASNASLRLPSFIFSVATPLLICWRGHPDRMTRLFWASLVALWLPGFYFATEARPYALLFFLATVQIILFLRLLDAPSRARAFTWAAVSALLILTHYHALVVTGLQGVSFLALKRRGALALWPAALLFVPMIAWMSVHLPLHIRFSSPDIAWHQLLSPKSLKAFPDLLLGAGRIAAALFLLVAATTAIDLSRVLFRKARWPYSGHDTIAVASSLAAIAFVYGLGFIRPSFTARYLIPFIPGFLLALAMWLRLWGRRVPLLAWAALLPLLWLASASLVERIRDPEADPRWDFSWQQASADLEAAGAREVIFLWDNPTTALGYEELLQRTGGFFFDRAGSSVRVRALILAGRGDVDPNKALVRAAGPRDALIWAFDARVPHTLATRHPPRISAIDPAWKCRNYGRQNVTILACIRG
ncbi:MAG TPA: hypothetical protein VF662_00190 [Allosphingosinicella sp.]|jgi:hypothetical protein